MNLDNNFKNVNPDIKDFSQQVEQLLRTRELNKFRISFVEKITILIISAFGLIAALAWDEAFKELFQTFFGDLNLLQEKFLYASIITVVAVILSIVLSRLILKDEQK